MTYIDTPEFPKAFADCTHEDTFFEDEDRSVGIFGVYWGCNDCGAFAEDYEQDEDGYTSPTPIWQPDPRTVQA